MSSTAARKSTLTEYVVIALSPALVMGLVGSLAFFLVEVFYGGEYGPELRWLLALWVFGAVLCARISLMGEIASRAPLYAGVLGVLVWIGTMRYVTYPPGSPAEPLCGLINAALVGIIYWSSHKITRDCTDVGGDQEVSGEGLLQAAGLEALDPRPAEAEQAVEQPVESKQAAKKRTPGVWIVYFSLAALPLFGLGQAFLPREEEDTRERAFWMLVVYTGCGLGLLLTTCFLSLRQYLRQRNLRVPGAMTVTWLAVGGGLIAVLLLAAALLPRPWAETGPFRYHATVSEERDASDYAQRGDTAGKGEGKGNAQKGASDPSGKEGKGTGEGKDAKGDDARDKGGSVGKEGKDNGGQHQQGKGQNRGSRGKDRAPKGEQGNNDSGGSSWLAEAANKVGPVLKWIVFGLLALAVLVFLVRSGLGYLAQFSQWARDLLNSLSKLWARLFGRRGDGDTDGGDADATEDVAPVRTFAEYRDPFADGSAQRMKATQLIRYAFDALQAWAAERDLARKPDETPIEFARRLGDEIPAIDSDARQLAALYTRAAYAPGTLPASAVEPLRGLWQRLEMAGAAPMSAFSDSGS